MYKNWPAICRISDVYLRLCIALTNNEELLTKLQKGFPECFTDEEPEHPGPFPLSALRSLSDRWLHIESDRGDFSTTHELLEEEVGFPVVWCGGPTSQWAGDDGALPLPLELQGETYNEIIQWSRENKNGFPRVLRQVNIGGQEYYLGWANESEEDMALYPCRLVDENA